MAVPDADCEPVTDALLLPGDDDEDVEVAAEDELDELLPQALTRAVAAMAARKATHLVGRAQRERSRN